MIKLNDSISVRLFSIPVRLQNKDGIDKTVPGANEMFSNYHCMYC